MRYGSYSNPTQALYMVTAPSVNITFCYTGLPTLLKDYFSMAPDECSSFNFMIIIFLIKDKSC